MSARQPTPVMQACGLSKRFGATYALRDVSLTVMPGESHALLGRNGAGKSTLVSMLTGLRRPDAGAIAFNGQPAPPLADSIAWRRQVACVYQHSTIIKGLSVAENLFINRQPLRGGLIDWKALRRQARALLDAWQVDVHEDARAGDLSVEARQLVEIACALSHGARFIILDEPTAQLDGEEIKRLFRRIRDLQDGGVTFLFISHHLQETYEICQTATVLRDARHILTLPVAELPKETLIEAMTGERGGLRFRTRPDARASSARPWCWTCAACTAPTSPTSACRCAARKSWAWSAAPAAAAAAWPRRSPVSGARPAARSRCVTKPCRRETWRRRWRAAWAACPGTVTRKAWC